jgi:hypothetical protein
MFNLDPRYFFFYFLGFIRPVFFILFHLRLHIHHSTYCIVALGRLVFTPFHKMCIIIIIILSDSLTMHDSKLCIMR